MDDKDKLSPATTSEAYDRMMPMWQKVEDLLGGTEAMRAAGDRHLPRHPEETDEAYRNRLQSATLYNVFEKTLNNLSSKPFSEPLKYDDDLPDKLAELLDNIDLQGNDLHVFSRDWFRLAMAKAFAHVLVDAPRPLPRPDGQPRTMEDDRKEGMRPYWVLIRPENVLFMESDFENGVEVLKHVRILECFTEREGFIQVHKKQIKVLEPGLVQIWKPKPRQNANQKEEWFLDSEWETGLDYIPMFTFYASERKGLAEAKPPLLDLADLNITHWQSTSEQRHVLTVARFPILACSGSEQEESDPIVVGPNKVLYNNDPQGKFYYVEHTGAAIEAGRNDLQDLEEKMASYGAEFLKDKPGDPTATAKAIDSAESNSELAQITTKFEDMLFQVLSATALWIGESADDAEVELVKNYVPEEADGAGLTALKDARASRDISRKTYLEGLRLRGVLPEDFDPDEDAEELQDEMDRIMSLGGTDIDLDPLGNPKIVDKKEDPEDGDPAKGARSGKPVAKKPAAKKVAKK